jgi:phosphatidylserine/phosphatidylglycerophosphate/cardiolipin synthase-like enzyme
VVFGDPWSDDPGAVHAVVDSAIRVMDETPDGETLTLSIFNFTYPPVREALVRAHERGVHVHVVVNARAAYKKQVRKLRAALGRDTSARSWVVVRGGNVRMHSKFLLASRSGDRQWVVWVSSGNMTNADGAYQVNESLTTTGDKALYDFLVKQSDLLRRSVTDRARLGRTATTPTVTVRTFPVVTGGPANDPVESLLEDVTCRHGDQRTVVRASHLLFKGERIWVAERLRRLATDGCDVRVIGHLRGWERVIVRTLTAPGPGRIDLRSAQGTILHTKITTVTGWDASGRPVERALVGTHNLSGRALTFTPGKGVNDELSLLVSTPEVVDAYNAFVDRMIKKHSVRAS